MVVLNRNYQTFVWWEVEDMNLLSQKKRIHYHKEHRTFQF